MTSSRRTSAQQPHRRGVYSSRESGVRFQPSRSRQSERLRALRCVVVNGSEACMGFCKVCSCIECVRAQAPLACLASAPSKRSWLSALTCLVRTDTIAPHAVAGNATSRARAPAAGCVSARQGSTE